MAYISSIINDDEISFLVIPITWAKSFRNTFAKKLNTVFVHTVFLL